MPIAVPTLGTKPTSAGPPATVVLVVLVEVEVLVVEPGPLVVLVVLEVEVLVVDWRVVLVDVDVLVLVTAVVDEVEEVDVLVVVDDAIVALAVFEWADELPFRLVRTR
jgi:hypothetical protein